MRSDLEEVHVEKIAETGAAYLVTDGTTEVWVPKSQCELEKIQGTLWLLTAPEWMLKAKGLL